MYGEAKIWILLFATAVLISFAFGAHYFSAVDEANLALYESKSKLHDMDELLVLRKKDWVEKEQGVAKIQVESDKTAKLLKIQEALDARYLKTESDLNYLADSIKDSVEKVRSNAVGMELGEITLADRRILRGVKVRKVDESGISLSHADGIGTIATDLLPENLKEKYDLGPTALLPQILEAHAALLSKKDGKDLQPAVQRPIAPPADPAKLAANIALDNKIKGIKVRMAQLDSQISSYGALVAQYNQAASGHQTLASTAQARGTPSTRHTANANDNLAQAAAVERQLEALRVDRRKLSIELEFALKNK
ncbi:MAG: hypothetical protein JWR15_1150 [Prosthecobacter sp.]|nr:hypothetical protein [Prosthecobacter sp.]